MRGVTPEDFTERGNIVRFVNRLRVRLKVLTVQKGEGYIPLATDEIRTLPDEHEDRCISMEGQAIPKRIGTGTFRNRFVCKKAVTNEPQGRTEARFVRRETDHVPTKADGFVLIAYVLERSEPFKAGRRLSKHKGVVAVLRLVLI